MKLVFLCAENKEWFHYPAIVAIEANENVDFNHVAIMDEDLKVYEAVWPKTKCTPQLKWLKRFKVVRTYTKEVSPEEYERFMRIVKSQIGVSYSIFQCAMIYVSNTVSFLERKIETSFFNGKKALICSEFLGRPIVEVFGYQFENNLDTVGMDEIEKCLKDISKVSK